MTHRPGSAIVEVLVGISIAALVIVSIGNLVASVNSADKAAANKTQALAYARESLELVAAIAPAEYKCSGGTEGGTCSASGQSCTALAGYTSCWLPCPISVPACSVAYHLAPSGGTWQLAADSETIGTAPVYTRQLVITDGDNNQQKRVTATVSWTDGNRTPTVTLTSTLSGWKP